MNDKAAIVKEISDLENKLSELREKIWGISEPELIANSSCYHSKDVIYINKNNPNLQIIADITTYLEEKNLIDMINIYI